MNDPSTAYVASGLFGFIALVAFLLAVSELQDTLSWRRTAMVTKGTVVSLKDAVEDGIARPGESPRRASTKLLTAEFSVGNKRYSVQASSALLGWFFSEGDDVDVRYAKHDPRTSQLRFFLSEWGVAAAMFALALFFAAAAAVAYRFLR
jgi:hypothetical protein